MARELWKAAELEDVIARYRRMYWSADYYAGNRGLRRIVKLLEREQDALGEAGEALAGAD